MKIEMNTNENVANDNSKDDFFRNLVVLTIRKLWRFNPKQHYQHKTDVIFLKVKSREIHFPYRF